jgi:hypothetical protein
MFCDTPLVATCGYDQMSQPAKIAAQVLTMTFYVDLCCTEMRQVAAMRT